MKPCRLLKACALLALAPLLASGSEWHVAPPPLGNDANPGTISQPLATIGRAEDLTVAGDVVHIHEGVYRETILFRNGGTEAEPITYQAYNDGDGPDLVTISGFRRIVPGSEGAGHWQLHAGSIYKIQLTPEYGLLPGASTVLIDGSAQKIARWPNAPAPFDFNWEIMARPEGAVLSENSGGPQLPFAGNFHTASYSDSELPFSRNDEWVGARIDMSPFDGIYQTTGLVTASGSESLTFRYRYEETAAVTIGNPYFLWNTLRALDQEGEYFFDIEGVSGPAYTLYLWPPGGMSPQHEAIEIRTRDICLNFFNSGHITTSNLSIFGGGVFCPSQSEFITMDRLHLRYCGQGLDYLNPQRPGIHIRGDNNTVTNCLIEDTYGGGIHANAEDIVITNNVVRNCMLYSIGSWGGNRVIANRNTTYLNGGLNIAMFSPASQFNYNHCYLAGLRTCDEANMNSHYNGDAENTEVAYNWVHTNLARYDMQFEWGGGIGIRLDTSASNFVIHHNLIWGMSRPTHSLVIFSLEPEEVNYQQSEIRAYNNTIAGGIVFPAAGSLGGHDLRNNICTEIREFHGAQVDSGVIRNNYLTDGVYVQRWPGNFFTETSFVSGPTGNFELKAGVPMIDAGEVIAPYTDGFNGRAPDVGALESGGPGKGYWTAGATLLPEHLAALTFRPLTKPSGQSFLIVENFPEGRLPPEDFKIRLNGEEVLENFRITYSTDSHRGGAYFEFEPGDYTGSNVVEPSLDGSFFAGERQTLVITDEGFSADRLVNMGADPGGGSIHRVKGTGFSPPYWMMPIHMENLTGADLNYKPVPLLFNSLEHIRQGRMKPNCSDLRLMHWESQSELPYFLESGINSETTLLWTTLKKDLLTKRFSHLDESTYYMTFGVRSRKAVSEWSVLGDYFTPLKNPKRLLWYSATHAGDYLVNGESVSQWPDLFGLGNHGQQPDPAKQPTFRTRQMNGLPAMHFDGGDLLQLKPLTSALPEGVTYVILHRNDANCDPNGRIFSAGAGGREVQFVRAQSTTDNWNLVATRRPGVMLTDCTAGKRFKNDISWYTGDVAEMIVIGERLRESTNGPFQRLIEFVTRKYHLNNAPRGIADTASLMDPIEIHLGDVPVTDITFIDQQTIEFVAPPAPPESLPLVYPVEVRRGPASSSPSESFSYLVPSYHQWAANLPVEYRKADDNPDQDGLPNLLEFAMDLSPDTFDSQPRGSLSAEGSPILQFRKSTSATDVLLQLDHSSDLRNWTRSDLSDLNLQVVDPDPDNDGSAVLYRIDLPSAGHCFWKFAGTLVAP